jgi:hypothetical protein
VARLARFGGAAPLSLGGSSSAGPRPPTIASMSRRRAGRPLAQGATVRGLSKHIPPRWPLLLRLSERHRGRRGVRVELH